MPTLCQVLFLVPGMQRQDKPLFIGWFIQLNRPLQWSVLGVDRGAAQGHHGVPERGTELDLEHQRRLPGGAEWPLERSASQWKGQRREQVWVHGKVRVEWTSETGWPPLIASSSVLCRKRLTTGHQGLFRFKESLKIFVYPPHPHWNGDCCHCCRSLPSPWILFLSQLLEIPSFWSFSVFLKPRSLLRSLY